ncbi:MAG: ATP:cob(I)alamin adenosyltransferase [Fibrobacteria bacterium]|jgi:cob(I)alamin adenosyltransferase|nr:ATP:cob(I)alamin adenosyltransferase [Fibrobacteria bacterium]
MNIDRVYTRTGDDGKTSLLGGRRVPKDHLRVEAYGCLDEVNSAVGLCRAAVAAEKIPAAARRALDAQLREIQNRLFDVGSVLSFPVAPSDKKSASKTAARLPLPGAEEIAALEASMDALNRSLKPLKSFVLPGGCAANAWLHHCRAACRRAERRVVTLARREPVPPAAIRYLNRLSDWFFVAARYASAKAGAPEHLWEFPLRDR